MIKQFVQINHAPKTFPKVISWFKGTSPRALPAQIQWLFTSLTTEHHYGSSWEGSAAGTSKPAQQPARSTFVQLLLAAKACFYVLLFLRIKKAHVSFLRCINLSSFIDDCKFVSDKYIERMLKQVILRARKNYRINSILPSTNHSGSSADCRPCAWNLAWDIKATHTMLPQDGTWCSRHNEWYIHSDTTHDDPRNDMRLFSCHDWNILGPSDPEGIPSRSSSNWSPQTPNVSASRSFHDDPQIIKKCAQNTLHFMDLHAKTCRWFQWQEQGDLRHHGPGFLHSCNLRAQSCGS